MGKIKKYPKVKLISGFIYKDETAYNRAKVLLKKRFGVIDCESKEIPFNLTLYYEKEFGSGLKRRFLSFKKLIPPEKLAQIKIISNQIENKLTLKGNRQVNIDPGYIDLAKLVLATTKDYKHRIYLEKGIFAEITLFFQDNSFKIWEWTYPDYRTQEYIALFNKIRGLYVEQIK